MSNNLTGQFIANTYQNLVQKPDLSKEEYYNGLGQQINVINRDAIGTIKMFYPVGGSVSTYFDLASGLGIVGTDWEGWALCDGRNGGPDLRGRLPGGAILSGPIGVDNYETLKVIFDSRWTQPGQFLGNTFSIPQRENIAPHKHQSMFWSPEDGDPWRWDGSYNYIDTSSSTARPGPQEHTPSDERWYQGYAGSAPVSGNVDWSASGTKDTFVYTTNTADGVNNVKDELELQPDGYTNPFYPPTTLLAFVIRVA